MDKQTTIALMEAIIWMRGDGDVPKDEAVEHGCDLYNTVYMYLNETPPRA